MLLAFGAVVAERSGLKKQSRTPITQENELLRSIQIYEADVEAVRPIIADVDYADEASRNLRKDSRTPSSTS